MNFKICCKLENKDKEREIEDKNKYWGKNRSRDKDKEKDNDNRYVNLSTSQDMDKFMIGIVREWSIRFHSTQITWKNKIQIKINSKMKIMKKHNIGFKIKRNN